MSQFIALFDRIVREEEGQDLVEYALLVALIALVVTVAVGTFEDAVSGFFTSIATTINGWT